MSDVRDRMLTLEAKWSEREGKPFARSAKSSMGVAREFKAEGQPKKYVKASVKRARKDLHKALRATKRGPSKKEQADTARKETAAKETRRAELTKKYPGTASRLGGGRR